MSHTKKTWVDGLRGKSQLQTSTNLPIYLWHGNSTGLQSAAVCMRMSWDADMLERAEEEAQRICLALFTR